MERRVTAVELRPINLLTSSQVAAALADEDPSLNGGPDTVVSPNAPNQYKRVIEGYYYSARITGTNPGKPRVELYFSADPGLSADDTIRVSGINNLTNGSTPVAIDISGDFKTISTDTPPWENRSTYTNQRHTPGTGITNTALFNPGVGTEYSARKALVVKRRISSVAATTTTATITFTATHYFKAGDVVSVDMPSDSPYYGLDGLFRVKAVTSNTITYDFETALAEPINSASVTEERYVYAVAQAAIRDGATWIDTSADPDLVYVWKDIRWVTYSTGDVSKDGNPPGPVENLEANSQNDTPDGAAVSSSRITLTWSPPSTNANGTEIDDLIGYTIWWRQYVTQDWQKSDITGIDTNWSASGFLQGKLAYFRVFARDSGGNLSTGVDVTHSPGVTEPTVATPKAPSVSTYLGTIKISYDDLTAAGLVQPGTAKEIQVYFSDVSNFTPVEDNYYGKFPANAGSYIIIPGTEIVDNTDYYIKIKVRDIYGNVTEPSDQVSIRAKLSDIVTYDMIDVGTLTGQVVIGLDVRTNSNPSVNGGVIMNQQGITAYDPAGGQTFRVNAITGQVSIGDYLGKAEAAGVYVGKVDADNKYATIVTANGISITANTANTNATNAVNTANTANSTANAANTGVSAITEISAGQIVLRKNKVVGAINGSTTNVTKIDGGVIETGTILASQIGDGQFPVGVVYAGEISASKVTSGTLTGRTVRTTSSAASRVTLNGSTNSLEFNSATGSSAGSINGATFPYNSIGISGAGGGYAHFGAGRVLIYGSSEANASIDIGNSQIEFRASSTTSAYMFRGGTSPIRSETLDGTTSSGVSASALGSLFRTSSDSRLKEGVANDVPGLDFVNDLNPISFTWKPEEMGSSRNYGLIAQEVVSSLEKHGIVDQNIVYKHNHTAGMFQEFIDENDTPYGFEYQALIPVLIKAVQDLSGTVESLKARLNDVEGQ